MVVKISVFITVLTTGILFMTTALAWSYILKFVKSQLILTPNSVAYHTWTNLPVPVYMDIYLYQWANAENYNLNPNVTRPKFEEVGPFVYEQTMERVNVSWSDDGSTIAYNQTRTWKFIPEASANPTVNVTNLNVVATSLAYTARLWDSKLYKFIANKLINKYESLFKTAPAENWIFKGINHGILDSFMDFIYIPVPYDKFGWFYNRNGSALYDGRLEMKTGTTDIYELGELVKWNYMNRTDYYDAECGEIRGAAGEFYPPVRDYEKSVTSFSTDLCSYIIPRDKGSEIVNGIRVNLYEGDNNTFDNGQLRPENRCFCKGECSPWGVRNVSECKMGSPAFVSFPHFYAAHPYYTEGIDGLEPNRDLHSFRLKLDPKTGIAQEIQAGIQVNLLLRPYDCCDIFKNKTEVYVPMVWFKLRAKITPELSLRLKLLHFAFDYGETIFFALAELCFFLLVLLMCLPNYITNYDVRNVNDHKNFSGWRCKYNSSDNN